MEVPANILPPLPSVHIDEQSYSSVLEQSEKRCPDQSCRLWHQYVRAKSLVTSDPAKSCEAFNALSGEKNFPLYPLVLIHQADVCQIDSKKESELLESLKEFENKNKLPLWLQQEISVAKMTSAQFSGSPDFYDFSLRAAKLARFRVARVQILQKAIDFSKANRSSKVRDLEEELYKAAPRFVPKPKDWVAVGHDAFLNHDYTLAIKSYEKSLHQKLPLNLRRLILENLKISYKANQKKEEALKVANKLWQLDLKTVIQKKPPVDALKHALNSGLSYARFVWTNHRDKEALKFIDLVEKKLKKRMVLAELYFLRGRILEEQKHYKPALFWFWKASSTTTDPTQQSVYGWNSAWLNYKTQNYDKAKSILENLSKTELDAGKKSQELFWLAKSKDALKESDEAHHIYEQIVSDDPLGYYSFLSYRELKKEIPTSSQTYHESFFSKGPKRLPASLSINWNLFDWLVSTGELEWARNILDEEAPLPEGIPDEWEELFIHYAKLHTLLPFLVASVD